MDDQPDIRELQFTKGVGPARAKALAESGILSLRDLLYVIPRSYLVRDSSQSALQIRDNMIGALEGGLFAESSPEFKGEHTLVGTISRVHKRRLRGKRSMLVADFDDGSGHRVEMLFFSHVDYFERTLSHATLIAVSGTFELNKFRNLTITHPELEQLDEEDSESFEAGVILPRYTLTQKMRNAGINARVMRGIVQQAFEVLPEESSSLPTDIATQEHLIDKHKALFALHFPSSEQELNNARNTLKFEELFFFELLMLQRKSQVASEKEAPHLSTPSSHARHVVEKLGFELTGAQKRVINEIYGNVSTNRPMNRLLQGDVGSGKTIVSLLAMLMAVDNGCQAAIMAPTEILAEQHCKSMSAMLEGTDVNVGYLGGGIKASQRREVLEGLQEGSIHILTGTHALFQEQVEYNNLGLVVIDEQHRFGVKQRSELRKLAERSLQGKMPHILVMTATPIPRTLSMTLYGDLDVSVIDELPSNRKPIKTSVVYESQSQEVFDFIKQQLAQGRQAYIVYPLVEESEKLDLKSAVEHHEYLASTVFPSHRIGLLHGQMNWSEKELIMQQFKQREFDILVSTTVVEVGVDVPNASVMLINNAERFGLSQLHQLRGRVGRGEFKSYCLLATKDSFKYIVRSRKAQEKGVPAAIRLQTMEESTDGFHIAQVDLELRGPGDFLGTKQSGLPDFVFVDVVRDVEIIARARKAANTLLERDPLLKLAENHNAKETLKKMFADRKDVLFTA